MKNNKPGLESGSMCYALEGYKGHASAFRFCYGVPNTNREALLLVAELMK